MSMQHLQQSRLGILSRGFTLIEILIVVIILGILATIVIPLVGSAAKDAEQISFVHNTKAFAEAAERYMIENGVFPADSPSGDLPMGMEDYIDTRSWIAGTPVGGVWDTEVDSFGIALAVGVHFDGTGQTRDDAYMSEIDAVLDDGDLSNGAFRKLDVDRYYFVLVDA